MLEYCLNCLEPLQNNCRCSTENVVNSSSALPAGFVLNNRFLIGRVLGSGGFGITYLARDLTLDRKVAIKEYFPINCVTRNSALSTNVVPGAGDLEEQYSRGLKKFGDESRTLAKVSNAQGIVRINDIVSANATSYIVMEYIEGNNLQKLIDSGEKYSFTEAYKMLRPVMQGLAEVHKKGLLHRDISPSNLILQPDGRVKLIDFGASKSMDPDANKSISVVLKPGYAPLEQFTGEGQCPATDVFSVCASIYALITGKGPDSALQRLHLKTTALPSSLGADITSEQEKALMHGLALEVKDRTSDMDSLIGEFDEAVICTDSLQEKPAEPNPAKSEPAPKHKTATDTPTPKPELKKEKKQAKPIKEKKPLNKKIRLILVAMAVVAAVALLIGSFKEKTSSFTCYDETITAGMIRSVKTNRNITKVSFYGCEMSDDIVKKLAKCSRVETVNLSDCTGYTSLNPLAEMKSLCYLTIFGSTALEQNDAEEYEYVLDGDPVNYGALFTTDFPTIEYFTIDKCIIEGGTDFIKKMPNLKGLSIRGCEGVTDVSALQSFPNLTYLYMNGTDLSGVDLSPISSITNKDFVLNLEATGIESIEFLSGMPNIGSIYIADNKISDLSPLAASCSEGLYAVYAGYNLLTNLSGLENSGVRSIEVNNNKINDISALENCTDLKTAYLQENEISDITPLASCTELNILSLDKNNISDISALSEMTKMTDLTLANNSISNLDALEKMIHLETLTASDNCIQDISGLSNTTVLEEVYLNRNAISDISPLSGNAATMEKLFLGANQISDISALEGFGKLEHLSLFENNISDISALSSSKKLVYFSAYSNNITDISPISGCTDLYGADLANNHISDISPLCGTKRDKCAFFLHNNDITDISVLPKSVDYKYLTLYGNPITDFSTLKSFTNISGTETLMISWREDINFEDFYSSPYRGCYSFYIVDAPLNQQVGIANENREYESEDDDSRAVDPKFISESEADEKTNDIRDQLGENAL